MKTIPHGTHKKIKKNKLKITYTLGLPPTMPVKPGAIKKKGKQLMKW